MKTVAVALVLMLGGAIATPYQVRNAGVRDQKPNSDIINGIVDSIIELLDGLDPYVIEYINGELTLPIIGGVFGAQGYVKNFRVAGFSGILNNGISFVDNTIAFHLGVPDVEATVDDVVGRVFLLNRNFQVEIRGRLAIRGIRIAGEVGMDGFDIVLDLGLHAIESDLEVIILGRDISDFVNKFLGQNLVITLKEYKDQLNRQIAIWVKALLKRLFRSI